MRDLSGTATSQGLTSGEAAARLRKYGPNAVPERRENPLLAFLGKFWAPVPWMLEATIVLEIVLGKYAEALIIGALLVFNSVLSFVQEKQSSNALALLRNRLSVHTRAMRDGKWLLLPAEQLVPGDVVYLRMGDIVPADIRLSDGELMLDQSSLTGESVPVEAGAGATAYAGATVKRGEAAGEVIATGARTYFGKTAELVGAARTVSHLQQIVLKIVQYLVLLDVVLVAVLFIYALLTGIRLMEMAPFALILLVASVPVALPATFTVATALGALELVKGGVLVTRLSAIEEAAAMDVLCADKTGTLTQNRLALGSVRAYGSYTEDDVLRFAALASDRATQDPIDVAILDAARERGPLPGVGPRRQFVPFEPATKRSEAVYEHDGGTLRVIKGAAEQVAALVVNPPDWSPHVAKFAADGYRVLAVAAGTGDELNLAGLVALADPPREGSRRFIRRLGDLGVRVTMVTGDSAETARAVAAQVGIGGPACSPHTLRDEDIGAHVQECSIIAGVYPEDKFRLVQALQRFGHITGMTGDGVNDAPALKQAEVGIAVSNATDVAKAAASMVLTEPGLGNVIAAVETSRLIYQRMLTYTLNKVVKTIQIAVYLSVGLMATGIFVVTPLLIILLLFANDFVTISIATDRVSFSTKPDRWRIGILVLTGAAMATLMLVLSFAVLYIGLYALRLPVPQLQTLIFIMLVFTGQANVYLVRERRHFWESRPSRWLMISSCADIIAVSVLAVFGILMAAINPWLVVGMLGATAAYMVLVDFVKIRVFKLLRYG